MEKWEYTSFLSDGANLEKDLEQLGEHGWEAVGFAPFVMNVFLDVIEPRRQLVTQTYRVLLKRRKP